MSDGEKIAVEVTANEAGVAAGMKRAVEAVRGGTEGMKGALEGLGGAFEAVMAPLLALMAVLKGGEFLKESIEETVEFYKSNVLLGRQLGISANEAGQLAIALDDVHSSTEQFSTAANMLTRQVKANEEGIKKLGLETRNADGSFRNSKDLMIDGIKVLNSYKEGTDRNLAATTLFGRGGAKLGEMLKLNNDVLEEAKTKQEELGLTVTKEGVEATEKYRAALNEAHDVMEGISVTVGTAVMPMFTQLGEWFGSIGPSVISAFKEAMSVLVIVIEGLVDIIKVLWNAASDIFTELADIVKSSFGIAENSTVDWDKVLKVIKITILELKGGIEILIEVISGFVQITISEIQRWYNIVQAALNLDFNGMASAWDAGTKRGEAIVNASAARIKATMNQVAGEINGVIAGAGKTHASTDPSAGGGAGSGGFDNTKAGKQKKGHDEGRTSEWDNKLAALKLAQEQMNVTNGTFYEFSKQQEADYWKGILAQSDLTGKERVSVTKKYLDAELAIGQQQYAAKLTQLKGEMDAYHNNFDTKITLAKEIAEDQRQHFSEDSKEYKSAAQEVINLERAKADQIKAVNAEIAQAHVAAALEEVNIKESTAQQLQQMGLISEKEMLQQEQQFEDDRYAINLKALQDRLELMRLDPDMNPVEYQKLKDQILEIDRAHEATKQAMKLQALAQSKALELQGAQALASSWGSTLSQMLTGQISFAKGVQGLWKGVVQSVAGMLQQMITKWLAQKLAALILGKAMDKSAHAEETVLNAKGAAAGAFKAVASIPVVGPFLAPIAAAAAFTGVMAFAEQGYDIPAGVNPMTQLHQKEMVLPAEQADVIRDMASNGGGQGAMPPIHIHAMDAQSFHAYLMDNRHHMVDVFKGALRDGLR